MSAKFFCVQCRKEILKGDEASLVERGIVSTNWGDLDGFSIYNWEDQAAGAVDTFEHVHDGCIPALVIRYMKELGSTVFKVEKKKKT